ncbi:hypothetical protein [Kitasatospora sp. NPDC050463]|uniref:hypothetical protein n=1 Tax=Kitasatospora sp. NPDC050463 TaxID=3155786 RepID=UPI0033F04677
MTTVFEIHNEAGPGASAHGERLHQVLAAAGTMAVAASGLELPPIVTVRMVTVEGAVRSAQAHVRHTARLAADSFGNHPAMREMSLAGAEPNALQVADFVTANWPMIQGQINYGPQEADAELVVMPAAHTEARASDRFLTCVFGHELTHLAQLRLWLGMLHAPIRLGIEDHVAGRPREQYRAVAELYEGHAQWVHRTIAEQLCGERARRFLPGDPEPSALYRQITACRNPALDEVYDGGERFVAALHRAGGLPLVERVLTDESLVPRADELADPSKWLARQVSDLPA